MITPMLNPPAIHHPGASSAVGSSREPAMYDETWRSVVEQRMAVRLEEAAEERLGRLARADRLERPVRARLGHALIALGVAIAGATVGTGVAGRAT
jgi:hypothetical protein